MNTARTTYTEGALARRYYEVHKVSDRFTVIDGGMPSSYSSSYSEQYADITTGLRWISVIMLVFMAYIIIAGLA